MSIKNLFAHYKTTSAGLVMIVGSIVHLIFAIRAKIADENTWTTALTVIVGGVGLLFAGDASNSEKNAAAIDSINQQGPSAFAAPLASVPPPVAHDESCSQTSLGGVWLGKPDDPNKDMPVKL